VTIRPARSGDEGALQALLRAHGLGHDGLDYTVWSHPCLVAVRNGEIVGMIQALAGRPYAVIIEFCVARAWQRKSVAVRLLEHLETVLRGMGCQCWMTWERKDDPVMQAYCERWGAERTGEGIGYLRRLL